MSFNIPRDNNNKIVRTSKTINVVPSLSQAISIGSTGNTNFASVNTLSLNNVVVTATGTQLNFVDVTPGIASASKALVLNSSSNITGINNISCNALIVNGTNITSSLFASASSDDANNTFMTTVVPGIAQPSKALILNSNNNIRNINKLSTQSFNINNTEITVNTNNYKNLNINNLNNSSANNFLHPNGYYLQKNSFNSTDDTYIKTTNWSSVCWSSKLSLYVAVCTGSVGGSNIVDTRRVITSTTGNTWSVQTIPTNSDLKFVCWSPKLSIFVAVGNVIIISSNGINWTTSIATVTNTLTGICWSEELSMFVAVSEASTTNKVLTSVDGIIWTMRYTPGNCQLKSICWSPELNLFVAGGGSSSTFNNIMASSDGINWSLCNTRMNGSTIISICWSPEKMLFLAVSSTDNTNRLSSSIFSNDGYNWTMFKDTYMMNGTKFTCVCWAKDINMFLSIEDENNSCYINYSTNGYFWKRSNAIFSSNKYNQIIWNSDNKQFIAVASNITSTSPNPKIAISSPLMISSQNNLASNSISFSKTDSKIGINTTSPNKLLEINSVNGNCFKHIFNLDTTKFVTYDVLSNGQFNVTTQKFFQIPSDNSTYGLMLNNTLIKTTPIMFNTYLTNNTLGTATKSKMLITDSNNSISGINALYCNSVIENGVTLSTSSNNQYFQNAISGTSVASSVLITDINNDITGINEISMNNLYINNSKLILPGNDIDITLLNNKVNEYRSSLNNAFTMNQTVTINNISGIYDMIWIKELNIFVGISSGTNRIIYSKDGINWINVKDTSIIDNNITSKTISVMNLKCICWSPELSTLIIFGRFASNRSGFLLSKDGIDWEISDNLSNSDLDIVSICWSPELKIFAGIGSSGTNRVVISNNGINWIPVRISTYDWNNICWCNTLKIFVASCSNSDLSGRNIIYSYDGLNWITVTLPYSYGIVSIAWSPSLNMIIAIPVMTDSPKKYYPFIYSYDVINWSLNHTLYDFAGLFTKINWLNNINMFIATSITTVSIAYSFNGYNWYRTNSPNNTTIKKIIWSEELQVILAFYESSSTILLLDLINISENTTIKSQSNEFVCDNVNFRVGLGISTPTFQLQLSSDSAAKPSTSTWTVSSDERLKENIVDADLNMCYNNIKNLKLKRYTWKDEVYTADQVSDRSKLGWIAQEVETVFPKAVEKHNMHGYEDCRTLNSDQIIASMYGCAKQIIKNYNNTKIFDKLNDNIKKLEIFINSLPEE